MMTTMMMNNSHFFLGAFVRNIERVLLLLLLLQPRIRNVPITELLAPVVPNYSTPRTHRNKEVIDPSIKKLTHHLSNLPKSTVHRRCCRSSNVLFCFLSSIESKLDQIQSTRDKADFVSFRSFACAFVHCLVKLPSEMAFRTRPIICD